MKRSRFKNKANKTSSVENVKLYKIQWNVLVKLNIQWNVVTKLNKKMLKELISKKNLQNEKAKRFFGSHVLQIKVFAIMKWLSS